jgi:hypothetical protein
LCVDFERLVSRRWWVGDLEVGEGVGMCKRPLWCVLLRCESEMGWKRKCALIEIGRKGGRRKAGSVGSVPQTL